MHNTTQTYYFFSQYEVTKPCVQVELQCKIFIAFSCMHFHFVIALQCNAFSCIVIAFVIAFSFSMQFS